MQLAAAPQHGVVGTLQTDCSRLEQLPGPIAAKRRASDRASQGSLSEGKWDFSAGTRTAEGADWRTKTGGVIRGQIEKTIFL